VKGKKPLLSWEITYITPNGVIGEMVEWIKPAQNMIQWPAFVDATMKLRIP
jgi:hypothetical protein